MAFDLINVFNIADNANLELGGAVNPTFAKIGKTPFLFVPGSDDDGLTVFKITDKGKLKFVDTIVDNTARALDEPLGAVTVAVGGKQFLITPGQDDVDHGVSVFRIKPNGKLVNTDNVADDATLNLVATNTVAKAVVGGNKFVFVSALDDNGISVFQLTAAGTLINKDNVDDGMMQTLNCWAPEGLPLQRSESRPSCSRRESSMMA